MPMCSVTVAMLYGRGLSPPTWICIGEGNPGRVDPPQRRRPRRKLSGGRRRL